MAAKQLTSEELVDAAREVYGFVGPVITLVNRWLARGDGAAVYRNHDLGHPDVGDVQLVSFGSPDAQLEVEEPPERLPDIGNRINWRYQLEGTYRGDPIEVP